MKKTSINKTQATSRCFASWLTLSSSLLLALILPINASETFTNWSWVNLGLSIRQTNLFVGDKIFASISVSNTVDEEHIVYRSSSACSCGFAWISMNELPSGHSVSYLLVPSGFGSFKPFAGHKLESFDCNLMDAYAITNAGLYSVTAVGWFPINESPTNNNQFATVITPPIVISLVLKPGTNAPPK